jgi:spore germination protein GerM
MKNKKVRLLLTIAFFIAGLAGSFFLFREIRPGGIGSGGDLPTRNIPSVAEDLFILRLYFPREEGLQSVEKRIPRRTNEIAIAEAVIEEYFRGAGTGGSLQIPRDVKLLGLYTGVDRILYIDLSDEIRRNFQGDALSEYLLLKGIYESLMSNLQNIQDVKILIEGQEVETLGGHIYLKYALKNVVSHDYIGDSPISGE